MEEVTEFPTQSHRGQEDKQASETERWASLIGGSALVLMGLQQRSLRGIFMTLAGGGLIYQGVQNKSTIAQIKEAIGAEKGLKVEKTVTINKPAEELYSFWRNFENLPKFMQHLKSVTVVNEQQSHWVAKGPLDTSVEWDAEVVKDEPNHLIAWASKAEADIENTGFIRFNPATGGRGTEVKVVMEYNPPGGAATAMLAKLFGEEPEQQIGDELNRFKQLMETGEIATTQGQPKGS